MARNYAWTNQGGVKMRRRTPILRGEQVVHVQLLLLTNMFEVSYPFAWGLSLFEGMSLEIYELKLAFLHTIFII